MIVRRTSANESGLHHAERDSSWAPEVRREILQGIVDVERRSTLANIVCWFVVAMAAASLPNAKFFIAPLLLRLVGMVCTRAAFSNLRKRLANAQGLGRALDWLALALLVGGIAWGSIMIPVVVDPFLNPGRLLVGGATITGITIVVSLLLPAPRLAGSFIFGFFLSFGAGLVWAPSEFALKGAAGIVALFIIFISYGLATVPRHRKAAETLVENRILSEELSSALANAEFLAFRDPLTGLANRRAFFSLDDGSSSDGVRHVLTIDLDHFKSINDTFGHAVGDEVLVGASQALSAAIAHYGSNGHIAARIGGEEFAAILNVADPDVAVLVAEMVRHEIALVATRLEVEGLSATASIGLSSWAPSERLDAALSRADSALYRAKELGRDRVESFDLAA